MCVCVGGGGYACALFLLNAVVISLFLSYSCFFVLSHFYFSAFLISSLESLSGKEYVANIISGTKYRIFYFVGM